MDAASAQAAWFFLFQGIRDLPEALIHGREELWLRHLLTGWAYNPETFTYADIATYVRAYAQPGGLRGAFEDYRSWRERMSHTIKRTRTSNFAAPRWLFGVADLRQRR
jgi:haloacetate dehalogenase